jgi:Tfp pilus assembly protein PilO
MDKNRLWVLGAVLVIGAVVLMGWVLGISPKLAEIRAADADRVSVEAQNSASELKLTTLKKQFESMGSLKDDLVALRSAVPNGADIPAFVAQLDTISQQNHVTITEISVSDAQPYVPVVVAAPAPAAAAPAGGSTPAPTAAAAAPVPAPAAAPTVAAPVPSGGVTAANFVSVPITLTVDGSYANALEFIDGLQKGTRLALVTTFKTAPAAKSSAAGPATGSNNALAVTSAPSGAVTTTISALIYVLLDSNAPVATPAG